MAQAFWISNGPNKLDLMLALFDKPQRGRARAVKLELIFSPPPLLVGQEAYPDWVSVEIVGCTVLDRKNEIWQLTGKGAHELNRIGEDKFKAQFSTRTRKGCLKLID